MNKKDSPATAGNVPTLLELAQTLKNRPKPPTLLEPSSDESDLDQPPVATKKAEKTKLTASGKPKTSPKPSPNTRRRVFRLWKNGEKFDHLLKSGKDEIIYQTGEPESLLVRSSTTKSLASKFRH